MKSHLFDRKFHLFDRKLDITFLKNIRTFNVFPKSIHGDIPFSNRYDVTYMKKRLLKNVLHKRDKEKKKLDAELTRKI